MKINLYLILILIAGSVLSLKAQTIIGTISNSTQPLAGANIKIEGKKQETSTDKNGTYTLQVDAGTHNLIISYIGYTQSIQKINIQQGQNLTLDVLLQTGNYMNEVVVVSSRKPSKISEIPGTVWVIDNQRLQDQIKGGLSLKEALAQLIPGLDAGPQGRTNYGQNLKGRNVLVMIDGVSLNSTRGVSRQFDAIDPYNMERITEFKLSDQQTLKVNAQYYNSGYIGTKDLLLGANLGDC